MFIIAHNPFMSAWESSDLIGKLIFVALFGISLLSWTIMIQKWWIASRVQQESRLFKRVFFDQHATPLHVSYNRKTHPEAPNAFFLIYDVLQKKTREIFEKKTNSLAPEDITLLETHASSTISSITKYLERHLYLLSTIVTLAPFLGLLGTVYGILITFSGVSLEGTSNQHVLGGLSLALTTTVVGLLNAIPALIGYNYLKNTISEFDHEMERFSTEIVSTLSLHYRGERCEEKSL